MILEASCISAISTHRMAPIRASNRLEVGSDGSGAHKTLLDTMPKIRDYAMHANWNKITPQDVGSVIGFVEQLLFVKFSSRLTSHSTG